MRSRREFLRDSLVVPIAAARAGMAAEPRIIAAPDCLSQESAAGFRSVLTRSHAATLVVLCGAQAVHPRLYAEVVSGAWLLWEMPPVERGVSHRDLFVHYSWPHATLTRAFPCAVPVPNPRSEAIAHYQGLPAATKRRIGRGGMILLGSMLGPNLRAEEPEARQLAMAIFSEIASGDTSTAASAST